MCIDQCLDSPAAELRRGALVAFERDLPLVNMELVEKIDQQGADLNARIGGAPGIKLAGMPLIIPSGMVAPMGIFIPVDHEKTWIETLYVCLFETKTCLFVA